MQLLTTAEQMRRLDRAAITTFRLPGVVLMENAGRAFVDSLERHVGLIHGKHVLIVCGKGNNGGDGFVIARHLANRGATVYVALLGSRRVIRGDARTNLDALLKIVSSKQSHITFHESTTPRDLTSSAKYDVIVDAIFGTGFFGPVPDIQRKVITWINKQDAFVAAVDISSGVDATTGEVARIAVKARLSVAMGLGKIGHYVGDGREHSGVVEIADIGIPRHLYAIHPGSVARVEARDIASLLPKRALRAHKYNVGKVLVIAGSRNFVGAAVLAAQAAMRTGAGAVVLAIPKSIHSIVSRKLTEVIVVPLPETDEGTIAPGAIDEILERSLWADSVAIGPGLTKNSETRSLVRDVLAGIAKPVVLDADGLSALEGHRLLSSKRLFPTVLTPHVGELAKLVGEESNKIELLRVEHARKAARKMKNVVVLKGAPTTVGFSDGSVYLNSTGNPGMATIGSGDVLTGTIASLIAQGMDAGLGAVAGVFIHGLAGDLAAQRLGQRGLMAMDILHELPTAISTIQSA
ncbi:MAG: NAD(P)H-hydrate dehydratase [Bacteroidota bacterium]